MKKENIRGEFTLRSDIGKEYRFILLDDGSIWSSYPQFICEDEREECEEDFRFVAERLVKVLQNV